MELFEIFANLAFKMTMLFLASKTLNIVEKLKQP